MNFKLVRKTIAGVMVCLSAAGAAMAADPYPERTLRFVVNFPPGGASDSLARVFGQELSRIMGQNVLIDNKPGAGGAIGMVFASREPADGYTFTMGTLGSAIVQPLIRKTPYDMAKDFQPVSLIATGPAVLVVNAESPYKSLADIVSAAKARPDALNFGSGGVGTFAHLTGAMLNQAAGIKMTHVPYRGGVKALNDVLANQLQMIAVDPPSALPQIRAGKLRAIAYTGAKRSTLLPDVPTFAESGYPELVGANSWSIWLPAGVPKDVADNFHKALSKAMQSPALREKFAEFGAEPVSTSPQELRAFVDAETARFTKIVKEQGIRGD
ncbi:Bug family tripartite tricarboxylate transporter substrate binding protein [Piscinibacter sakaiensis]|uniref:Bug family tripartite tricarboxylate transporter substrate binding protein n=1 Tax=Piscinibacter sakaiensis TaxID=1547922 RepID=UPI003AAA5256